MGGVAASILGRPRATRDIDILVDVPRPRWRKLLLGGMAYGFFPRCGAEEALRFAIEARVLLLRHQATGIDVDVVLGALPFERGAVRRARKVRIAGCLLPLISPEDLIIMKGVALRGRDLADIAAILESQSKLDLRRVRRVTRQFAQALERPEIVAELERLLVSTRRPGRKQG
ncbi:MAG: nucleotidyl transferase AbiEii/AbiGii toxin family protein [Planctomycetaceae bacterium]